MSLIEGVGDEVTHFFIALLLVLIASAAWWTTSISDQGGPIRTVLLLERRRHRARRRLTNHIESVDLVEANSSVTDADAHINTAMESDNVPVEACASTSSESSDVIPVENNEQNRIVETMDSQNPIDVVRQRRLAYHKINSDGKTHSTPSSDGKPGGNIKENNNLCGDPNSVESNYTIMEHNYADLNINAESTTPNISSASNEENITIKLKYLNDDLKLVDGKLKEQLGDFKKRHFQVELSSNKLVRLIFNGHVLQHDTETLQSYGFFDNCVVHCLIHQRRPASEEMHRENTEEGFSASLENPRFNINNQEQEWHLENYLLLVMILFFGTAWYSRYVYSHLYTITATIGLILITLIFTIIVVSMYFPDNNQLHQQRTENTQSQQ